MSGAQMALMNNTATAAAVPPTPSIVTANLQLYLNAADSASYPGSGTTWTDLSANGYSASIIGAPSWGGTYFSFDGFSTQYVNTNQSLSANSFSIGAWFRTTSPGIKMLISKETTAGMPWNYRMWMNGGSVIGDVATASVQDGLGTPVITYNDGSWYLAMFTRNDTTWRLYINGTQVTSMADPFTGSITNAQQVWIGRSAFTQGGASPSGSYQFQGDIGQIFIYSSVLTADDILQNYNATRATYGL
jgi:hypothetical protein